MEEPIVVGIDIGTTKICTLVARLEGEADMRILGVGIEPALGIKKGNVVDINAATQSISRSIEKAQRTSGLEIQSALVSLAGSHVAAMNSRGVVGISGGIISQTDVDRSLESAMAVAMPHNCDIGGGTSDLAIYINGDVWHTNVLPVGGNHITQDIAIGLRISAEQAEQVKKQYGHAITSEVGDGEFFTLKTFGEELPQQISRRELVDIIEARVEEIFQLLHQEIRRSGYDNLLPAGMILTGGTSLLPGIRQVAANTLNMPVRIARPENLLGLSDQLQSPAYSTSVGLLKWSEIMAQPAYAGTHPRGSKFPGNGGKTPVDWNKIKNVFDRLFP